jgi:small-conductance mechanosensitive channel
LSLLLACIFLPFCMQSIWEQVYAGNTLLAYIIAVGGIVVAWIIIRLIKGYLLSWLKHFTSKTVTHYDDLLISTAEKFVIPFLYLFINYSILKQLNLRSGVEKVLDGAMAVITLFYAVRLINHVIHISIGGYMRRKGESEERIRHLNGLLIVVKAIVWVIGLLTLANNFGFDVSTLLASLGVGGIAIALASQAILGDLFSYLVIFFDKPFEIGDFVILNGDVMGVVEYIGIKTTRIRSLGGEQLILSNTNMTSSVIRNYKRMERRRVVFKTGVLYQTGYKQLQMIPGIITEIVKAQKDIMFDRAHLLEYGPSSINFEVVYYMLTADYNQYMDTQQTILFSIHEAFIKRGIEFAYPVQTVIVQAGREEPAGNGKLKPAEQPGKSLQ